VCSTIVELHQETASKITGISLVR